MNDEEKKLILRQYKDDLKTSQEAFIGFKKKMKYARQAYLNQIPEDIKNAASNEIYLSGNDYVPAVRDSRAEKSKQQSITRTCSKWLHPMHIAIQKKMIENMTAIPPRYEWDANSRNYVKTSRALEREFTKFYTRMNLAGKTPKLIKHFVVDGVFVQQTIFKKMADKVNRYKDGRAKEEEIYNKGAIDYILYDPMTTYFDWDADPLNYRETAYFIIVTINSSMTYTAFKRKYPKYADQVSGNGQQMEDIYKEDSGSKIHGLLTPSSTVVLREYYTRDGNFYVIANDSVIVDSGKSSNGDMSKIPINVGFYHDNYTTLWEDLKWPIAAMSNAFNQVADNNSFNNTAPIWILGDIVVDPLAHDPADGRKMYRLTPVSNQIVRAQDAMHQFTIPEITNGAKFMFDTAKESLFYVTGTTDMSFGMQDKQIRNQTVADMIGDSLVRSDSAAAKKIESSFYNPVTWDILMIFYTRYDDFDFKDANVPAEFLKNYRNIRVVNGSYLPSDRMMRLAKLQQALEVAKLLPNQTNLENLMYDLYEAYGFTDPYRYLMTNEEVAANDLAAKVNQLLGDGAIDEAQAQQALEAINLIRENADKFQEQ